MKKQEKERLIKIARRENKVVFEIEFGFRAHILNALKSEFMFNNYRHETKLANGKTDWTWIVDIADADTVRKMLKFAADYRFRCEWTATQASDILQLNNDMWIKLIAYEKECAKIYKQNVDKKFAEVFNAGVEKICNRKRVRKSA